MSAINVFIRGTVIRRRTVRNKSLLDVSSNDLVGSSHRRRFVFYTSRRNPFLVIVCTIKWLFI